MKTKVKELRTAVKLMQHKADLTQVFSHTVISAEKELYSSSLMLVYSIVQVFDVMVEA